MKFLGRVFVFLFRVIFVIVAAAWKVIKELVIAFFKNIDDIREARYERKKKAKADAISKALDPKHFGDTSDLERVNRLRE